ncbi:ROK family protein [Microbispora hainanensis]|uniref:ROK family protein n=1 Tax=Microbispora hainanensis TaxID=568844 RepID=A0A544YYB0_9ACTN|nr:ROK family protein [Microbispora hainanensis]TQS21750.1 ROK family protein [Microbispora hainanensis]
MTTFVGIDVGGTSVRVLAETPDGRGELVTAPVAGSYDAFLDQVAGLCAAIARPAGVGIGLPGTSGESRPMFVPALPWLEGRALREDLEARLGAPVRLGLDGHLTLLAEAAEGAAKGVRSAVLLAVGTGIGGALLIDGRIWRGVHGSAGSWGWLPADVPNDPLHGPFEQAASGSSLRDGPALVAAARAGDERARAALDAYAARLARGVAAVASTIDPEIILIGGGLADAMDVLGPPLQRHVARFASPDGRRVPVRPAALGSRAGAVGALLIARTEEW